MATTGLRLNVREFPKTYIKLRLGIREEGWGKPDRLNAYHSLACKQTRTPRKLRQCKRVARSHPWLLVRGQSWDPLLLAHQLHIMYWGVIEEKARWRFWQQWWFGCGEPEKRGS
jgi:hypothetical protein